MPNWFISWSIVAVFSWLASLSGRIVIETTLLTNGLVLPLWTLAVNLWWVMILISPWVWLTRRGKPVLGFAITTTMLAVLVACVWLYIGHLRDTVVPQPAASLTETTPTATPARSLEIEWTDNRSDLHSCEILCQQVLTGGDIQWLRVSSSPEARLPQRTIIYYRAPEAECAAVARSFPAGATCLLARPDDDAKADLKMEITELGDFYLPLEAEHATLYLTGTMSMTLTDQRGAPVKLAEQSLVTWAEPRLMILQPNIDIFNQSIAQSGGGRFHLTRRERGSTDLAGALIRTGLRLAPARPAEFVDNFRSNSWSHGGFVSNLPYDAPLQATMFAVAQNKSMPGHEYDFLAEALMPRKARPSPAAAAPKPPLVRRTAQQVGENDLRPYFETILKGQSIDRLHALNIIVDMITDAPDGTYDAYGDICLNALNTGTADHGLIPLLGQFGFDPTPYLRQRWTTGVDEAADDLVLKAACRADVRWAAALAPFVAEAARSIVPKAGDPKFFAAELRQSVLVLAQLGRADLARLVADSIDWQVVDATPAIGKLGLFPPLTRQSLTDLVENPNPC